MQNLTSFTAVHLKALEGESDLGEPAVLHSWHTSDTTIQIEKNL